MSDNAEHNAEQVEQITKTPSNVSKIEKDPKRVAAGKKLAENNKRMREEYVKYKALEAQRAEPETKREGDASGEWLSKLSLTNVISLVGIGLTVYNIFVSQRENTNGKHVAWQEPVHTTYEEPKATTTNVAPEAGLRGKPKPKPKFGM